MQRRIESHGVDGDWLRVSTATPCPICGGDGDCSTHADEAFACCVTRPSDWRLTNGGWLHRVASRAARAAAVTTVLAPRASDGLLADATLHGVAS